MRLRRIKDYARLAKIQFTPAPWRGSFRIKGFSPHLRQVHVLKNNPTSERLWQLHDVLHIFFYDFIFLNSNKNKNVFLDQNRFYEIHLASEAFAVLALDYFLLSNRKSKTITIDFYQKDYEQFQKINPRLPDFKSYSFIKFFVNAYLTGQFNVFTPPPQKKTKKYSQWIDHEISYSAKQRTYVTQWWNDLNLVKNKKLKAVVVENSFIFEAVFDALEIFFGSPLLWKSYLKQIKKVKFPINYFSKFKKFNNLKTQLDFRFTDLRAVNENQIHNILLKSKSPNASDLFLLWQIFSQLKISYFTKQEQYLINKLYLQSQSQKISPLLWQKTIAIAQIKLKSIELGKAQRLYLANFFLF